MKIAIIGAGEVGSYLSQVLSQSGHDVVVVDTHTETCARIDEQHNVKVIQGNGASATILKEAGVQSCDCFLAMTSEDQINLLSSSIAHAMGAKMVITRIHDQTYTDTSHLNYQAHFGIDFMINPEGLTALELAKSIRNPARVAVESLARGQIEAQRFEVSEKSKLIGKTLREVKLPSAVRFGFIQREGEADVPTADTELRVGDRVLVFGPAAELYKLRTRLDPDSAHRHNRVVIFGGGETAVALLRLLNNSRFSVRVIEKDPDTCRELAERFPWVTIIRGDGTSLHLLQEEQIGEADFFVASTREDERNIMTSAQAAKLGAKHVQTVVNKSDYEDILGNLRETLGLKTIVSPRVVTANEVIRYMSQAPYVELLKFEDTGARIVEVVVTDQGVAAGKSILETAWPQGAVIISLLHKFHAKVPGPEDRILPGDRVIMATREENLPEITRILRGA